MPANAGSSRGSCLAFIKSFYLLIFSILLLVKFFSSTFSFLVFINDFPFLMNQPPEKEISEGSEIRYACHVVRLLLPWLRKLRQEQMEEKKLEAKIKGTAFWCSLVQSFN